MALGFGTLIAGMVCGAFGALTATSAVRHQRAYQRKKHITQILKQLGEGEQLCGEIIESHGDDGTLGALCSYDISFLGTDGLSRKIAMPVQLDINNRYEIGTTMLLRMSPAPIEPLLLPLNMPEQRYTNSLAPVTVQTTPMDATGRVMLEQDFFALRDALKQEKKRCTRAMMKYGVTAAFAGIDLFGIAMFFLYLLMQ